jgi:phosphoglycolate phosphatase (TIGR01487 family)
MEWLPVDWAPDVVVVDIDGTLTDENKRLSMVAVHALQRLEKHGIPVVLATGNVRAITYGLWRFLGLSGPICCENGGVLWHRSWNGHVLRASGEEARRAAVWLEGEIDGLDSQGIETNQWRESEWCLFPYEDLDAVNEAMARSEWKHLDVVRTGFAIHLMEPHISKGHGLTDLFQRMNWSPSQALCVGDAPNDLSMFEFARWAVAVGGAFEEVAKAADVVSPHMQGDTFPPLVDAIIQARANR